MSRAHILVLILALALGSLVPALALADDAGKSKDTAKKAPLIFVPPSRGAPDIVVGGGTRGIPTTAIPRMQALVPAQLGYTLESQPTLYWYLAEDTDVDVVLTVKHGDQAPLLEHRFKAPLMAGVHEIRLADHGKTLEKGVVYQWILRAPPELSKGAEARITGGAIERIDTPAELGSTLAGAGSEETAYVLASAGIWYDGLDAISARIEAAPNDPMPRLLRAQLLEGVGLEEVAKADRDAAASM